MSIFTEISRKLLHVSTALIPGLYLFIDRQTMLMLLAGCVLVAVVVEMLRYWHAGFLEWFRRWVGFMIRPAEWSRITGATYVLVGALIAVWLFPKWIAIVALLCLALADTAASLVGLQFGRERFLGKSLAGSLAFFVTALIIGCLAMPESRGVALVAAFVATIAEALPALKLGRLELNDNLTIPLLTGAAIWLLQPETAPALVAAWPF